MNSTLKIETLKIETFRTRRLRWWASPFLSGLLLLPILAPAGQSGRITLRNRFKQGDITRYQVTLKSSIDMPNSSMVLPTLPPSGKAERVVRSLMEFNVLKVTTDGGAEVEIATMDSVSTTNGQSGNAQTHDSAPPLTLIYDGQGSVKRIKELSSATVSDLTSEQMANIGAIPSPWLYFSARSLKPGDTWVSPVKLPSPLAHAVMQNTFVGIETVNGYKTARIRSRLNGRFYTRMDAQGRPTTNARKVLTTTTGTITVVGDTNFAIAQGKVIRRTNVWDMASTMKVNKKRGGRAETPSGAPLFDADMRMQMQMRMIIAE